MAPSAAEGVVSWEAATTKAQIPGFLVDVEPMPCPTPLHAAVKQGGPPKGWAKVKLEIIAVSDMSNAEIIIL
ncbi:hypothetical protein V6N12_067082 [Hibiscus sabdariffa]|uniref:Uncharacterized protein n=1 Tax=Hibiscus sabdariffa TaxID=183260 RepID=A0ABR2ANF8_9ROSI